MQRNMSDSSTRPPFLAASYFVRQHLLELGHETQVFEISGFK